MLLQLPPTKYCLCTLQSDMLGLNVSCILYTDLVVKAGCKQTLGLCLAQVLVLALVIPN